MEIISGDSGNDEPVDSMEMFDFSYGKTVGFNAGFGMSSSLQAVELLGRPLPEVLFHCCPARQRGAYARPSIHIISCLWCGPSRKTRKVWLDIQTLPKMMPLPLLWLENPLGMAKKYVRSLKCKDVCAKVAYHPNTRDSRAISAISGEHFRLVLPCISCMKGSCMGK